MGAYYNEIDPFAAQWLRNLIAAGHIAPGDVDERSIVDVRADDLRSYRQCHFFAGIGVWSYALRKAGWSDEREVWTGSCPCQSFSAAGSGRGFNDERHLWPHWFGLIRELAPRTVFGEQVASADGLAWLDFVCADMEGEDYAIAPLDLCAAGFGAPHIRQRLFFVADAGCGRVRNRGFALAGASGGSESEAHQRQRLRPDAWDGGESCELADTEHAERRPQRSACDGVDERDCRLPQRQEGAGGLAGGGEAGGMDNAADARHDDARQHDGGSPLLGARPVQSSPVGGFWADAEWFYCRDDKWRAVEPGTFPLAHGTPGRVGRLRAYGNSIVPQVAAGFIEAYMLTALRQRGR